MPAPLQINWRAQDWRLKDKVLAARLCCAPATVWVQRQRCAPARHRQDGSLRRFDFAGIDWSLSDADVAFILGCSPSLAAKTRRAFKRPRPQAAKVRGRPRRVDWDRYDFSLSVRENARKLGCSESYALRIRKGKK